MATRPKDGKQRRKIQQLPCLSSVSRFITLVKGAGTIAAFVSGGHDSTPLPLGFALDGYGQAGFVTGKSGGGFADAQLHALKNMASNERISLTVGAGVWAGGQSNIMRVDMGPSVRAKLQAGKMSLRLDASWRFRIVGNARPGDSPAVTLSTSF